MSNFLQKYSHPLTFFPIFLCNSLGFYVKNQHLVDNSEVKGTQYMVFDIVY